MFWDAFHNNILSVFKSYSAIDPRGSIGTPVTRLFFIFLVITKCALEKIFSVFSLFPSSKSRHRFPGISSQICGAPGLIASAGIFSLDNMINRIENDHENAKILAKQLSDIKNIEINTNQVHTNIIFIYNRHQIISNTKLLKFNIYLRNND